MAAGSRDSLPLRIRTAHGSISDLLKEEILTGQLKPGTRLLQNELAARLSISTTPVREALRQLSAEGLLDADPHRGTTVHETSLAELEQISKLRDALEPLAMEATIEHITDEQLEQAEVLVQRIDHERDPAEFAKLNAEFHQILTDAAKWPRLATILGTLRLLAGIYLTAALRDGDHAAQITQSNEDHKALLRAIRDRDVPAAQQVTRQHVQRTLEAGQRAMGTPTPPEPGRSHPRPEARTIRLLGIGPTLRHDVVDRFYSDTGYRIEPVIDTLTGIITRMLTEPDRFDAVDQNATYMQPMLEAGVLAPIPVASVPNWKDARALFIEPDATGAAHGWPVSQVYWPDDPASFAFVPQYYNFEALGYNAAEVEAPITSYGALFDDRYAGRVAIWNDAIWTIGLVHNLLAKSGAVAPPVRAPGDLLPTEVDLAIQFLRKKKRAGQFRAFWSNYTEVTDLLATGEIILADGWIPAFVEARRRSGRDIRYANPVEGNRPWFHGLGLSANATNPEGVAALANWRLEGWFGARVAPLGYYSPTRSVEKALAPEAYAEWYQGKGTAVPAYDERTTNVAFWPQWPSEYDYYLEAWSRFLAS